MFLKLSGYHGHGFRALILLGSILKLRLHQPARKLLEFFSLLEVPAPQMVSTVIRHPRPQ